MNILLIGSGGREHAFAYKLKQSKECKQLYIMPGNAGTTAFGQNVKINPNDFPAVLDFSLQNQIDMVVVGPEEPLVLGLRDYFEANEQAKNILFVGPDKMGATMEGSKDWSKAFMYKNNIPTAAYQTFTSQNLNEGIAYLKTQKMPIVLKADGLAAGKGVLICETLEEAIHELQQMISDEKFGAASSKVVIEEFLSGIELSVFVLSDGNTYKILPTAKDYKRIGEGDTGLNTGGMGAISPVPFADDVFMQKVIDRIIEPTVKGLKAENIKYIGFIFIGLIKVGEEPFVIEYNCRMGDPETETVLPLIESDFTALMVATAKGDLHNIDMKISSKHAATVMMVSKGYPNEYEKGKVMSGFNQAADSMLFHAGTALNNEEEVVTNGGRVLAITSFGNSLSEAVQQSLTNAEKIQYEGKYFRKDIGYEFK
ncbi:MAG: phosphoribosylamine--glycine ligase [Bacteroidota bacterium]